MSPSEVRVELTKVFRNIFGQTTLESFVENELRHAIRRGQSLRGTVRR